MASHRCAVRCTLLPGLRLAARPLAAALLAPLTVAVSPLLAPAVASTLDAWEELRLRAVQTCTAELLSRNANVIAVERFDSSGARWQPSEDGMRVRLKVQRPGQAAKSVVCSYRRPLFIPSL
jgi:hypothetical protein